MPQREAPEHTRSSDEEIMHEEDDLRQTLRALAQREQQQTQMKDAVDAQRAAATNEESMTLLRHQAVGAAARADVDAAILSDSLGLMRMEPTARHGPNLAGIEPTLVARLDETLH